MQNIKDLRKSLTENYGKILSNEMPITVAKELANTAGKILVSCRTEMEYNKMMGIKKEIDFLKTE